MSKRPLIGGDSTADLDRLIAEALLVKEQRNQLYDAIVGLLRNEDGYNTGDARIHAIDRARQVVAKVKP